MSGKKAKSMTIKVTVTVEYGNGDRGESSAQIEAVASKECSKLPPAQDYAATVLAKHFRELYAIENEA